MEEQWDFTEHVMNDGEDKFIEAALAKKKEGGIDPEDGAE